MIDVIIPVYRGLSETRRCIESVLAARCTLPHEVIVIDDASPEPEISAWLRSLGPPDRFTLIAHDANRGFVASVNEGMAVHAGRDVVLLNSDTEVADGWLDRLAGHAARDPAIGTTTPFSSNATLCSYPRPLEANELHAGETTASLDRAFAAANAGMCQDIPTAVGFCMFIARRCLDQVGTFDVERYGKGYGEEVDFCMRAARAGFRNVAAADVFVRHVGEVSFGSGGAARRLEAQATVDALYPEFQPALAKFLASDPLRLARRRADVERLRRSPRPRLLFTTHPFGGGIGRHIAELAAALEPDCEVLLLRPHLRSFFSLTWMRSGETLMLWFHAVDDWDALIELLQAIGTARVHFHHFHGLPQSILELPRRLAVPHDVTLHDYVAVCPSYHLTDSSGRYCGERGEGGCQRCLDARPAPWPLTIDEWRSAFRTVLAAAKRVIAPSHDAARRIERYFPEVRACIWPHAVLSAATPAVPVRVLVPGALSPAKGMDVLEACARDALERGLALHFRVVGYLARPLAPWPELPVTITGEYRDSTLPALLAAEHGDIVFFPAQCPETFSYTLSAAIASGLPIVATDLGAFPERLAGLARARVLAWDAPARTFNDALLTHAGPAFARVSEVGEEAPGTPMAEYRARYLEGIAGVRREGRGAIPQLDARWLAAPGEDVPQPTLLELFDDGVRCGNAGSLAELRRQAEAADHSLGAARAAVAERNAARAAALVERLCAEAAKKRVAELEASTSWRLSAPLRALARLLRPRR